MSVVRKGSKEIDMSKEIQATENRPAYLADMHGPVSLNDGFDATDVVVPRIKLLQATSEEVQSFDTARPGHFWHTGYDKSLGDSFTFVVCTRRKKYLLTAPLEDGQGILARAEDARTWDRMGEWRVKLKGKRDPVVWKIDDLDVAHSGLLDWGSSDPSDSNSPPAATLFYDYLVLCPEHLELGPAVISLTRSAIKKAKKGLNDKIALHASAGRPMQALIFRAKSIDDRNADGNAYRNWSFTSAGFAQAEIFEQATRIASTMGSYKIHDEAKSVEEEPTRADSDAF